MSQSIKRWGIVAAIALALLLAFCLIPVKAFGGPGWHNAIVYPNGGTVTNVPSGWSPNGSSGSYCKQFDTNTSYSTILNEWDGCITPPANKTFTGWDPAASETKLTTSTEFRAQYEDVTYTVTFDAKGGSPTPEQQIVVGGQKATEPSVTPSLAGKTFDGWYKVYGEMAVRWNFASDTVYEDTTLIATWRSDTPELSFTGVNPENPAVKVGNKVDVTLLTNNAIPEGYKVNCKSSDESIAVIDEAIFSSTEANVSLKIKGVSAGTSNITVDILNADGTIVTTQTFTVTVTTASASMPATGDIGATLLYALAGVIVVGIAGAAFARKKAKLK